MEFPENPIQRVGRSSRKPFRVGWAFNFFKVMGRYAGDERIYKGSKGSAYYNCFDALDKDAFKIADAHKYSEIKNNAITHQGHIIPHNLLLIPVFELRKILGENWVDTLGTEGGTLKDALQRIGLNDKYFWFINVVIFYVLLKVSISEVIEEDSPDDWEDIQEDSPDYWTDINWNHYRKMQWEDLKKTTWGNNQNKQTLKDTKLEDILAIVMWNPLNICYAPVDNKRLSYPGEYVDYEVINHLVNNNNKSFSTIQIEGCSTNKNFIPCLAESSILLWTEIYPLQTVYLECKLIEKRKEKGIEAESLERTKAIEENQISISNKNQNLSSSELSKKLTSEKTKFLLEFYTQLERDFFNEISSKLVLKSDKDPKLTDINEECDKITKAGKYKEDYRRPIVNLSSMKTKEVFLVEAIKLLKRHGIYFINWLPLESREVKEYKKAKSDFLKERNDTTKQNDLIDKILILLKYVNTKCPNHKLLPFFTSLLKVMPKVKNATDWQDTYVTIVKDDIYPDCEKYLNGFVETCCDSLDGQTNHLWGYYRFHWEKKDIWGKKDILFPKGAKPLYNPTRQFGQNNKENINFVSVLSEPVEYYKKCTVFFMTDSNKYYLRLKLKTRLKVIKTKACLNTNMKDFSWDTASIGELDRSKLFKITHYSNIKNYSKYQISFYKLIQGFIKASNSVDILSEPFTLIVEVSTEEDKDECYKVVGEHTFKIKNYTPYPVEPSLPSN